MLKIDSITSHLPVIRPESASTGIPPATTLPCTFGMSQFRNSSQGGRQYLKRAGLIIFTSQQRVGTSWSIRRVPARGAVTDLSHTTSCESACYDSRACISGWDSERTVSRVWKIRAKRVRTHWDQIRHDRFRDATSLVPHHVNVVARRGFNSPGSRGKDMRRASRIITLVDGQRSCPHGEKHRPRMRVPPAEPTRLESDDLGRHIDGLVGIQPYCPIEGLVPSFHAELRHRRAPNRGERDSRRGRCFDDEGCRTNERADRHNWCDVNELHIFRHANSGHTFLLNANLVAPLEGQRPVLGISARIPSATRGSKLQETAQLWLQRNAAQFALLAPMA
jgi:hypothetical protein